MRDTKAKVLLLTTNLGLGGAQRVVRDHARELSRSFPLEKAVFNRDGGDFYGEAEDFISLEVPGGGGPAAKLTHFLERVRRTRRLKSEYGIDVSISHLEGADYINVLSRGREKTILCIHGSKLSDANIAGFAGWLRKSVLIPWLYNRADAIVTVSRDIVPELQALGVHKPEILTINNFFDVERIERSAAEALPENEEALFGGAPVLVTAGRLAPQKNQAPLMDLMAALKQRQKVHLLLLGDGELREALIAHGRGLGLSICEADRGERPDKSHDVWLMGSRQNPFPYLKRASLFLLPSGWEGFPMALCEALACSCPVIASDCATGPREILAPDTSVGMALDEAEYAAYGILAPVVNPSQVMSTGLPAWIGAVERLLEDDAQRAALAEAGRRRVDDFRPEPIVRQWAQLIERMAAR